MKNVLTLLASSAMIPLGLAVAASAADSVIRKKIYKSGMAAPIISNKEMEDSMKIVKSLEKSGFLTEGVSKGI